MVVVLYEPLLGFDIVLKEVAEGGQLRIARGDEPLEEVFAASDGLFEGKEHAGTVGKQSFAAESLAGVGCAGCHGFLIDVF